MTAKDLRESYIAFFQQNDHTEIPGKSLIPENDPTALFTMAGMHPLVPYILGDPHPSGQRLVNYQKCIRTGDIDDVGDDFHLTFFEMLGNWSLGDYFKKEAIAFSFEFLTASRWLGLNSEDLHVTVFAGDDSVPADNESAEVWRSLGIPKQRIYYLPKEDNWWASPGRTGPCGPDTEMFIDTGKAACSAECRPGCSCGKYFEIWNDVFMEYNRTEEGGYESLENKTVDTGMGVERTVAMLQGRENVFTTELFWPLVTALQHRAVREYGESEETNLSYRIVADHVKAACFILGDAKGIKPSNLGQGYILRRLIRRAIRHGRKLKVPTPFLAGVAAGVVDMYRTTYPELAENQNTIFSELSSEEERFSRTLKKGETEFEKLLPNLLANPKKIIPGRISFRLYDTYGFPLEITEELASEHGLRVDREGFDAYFKKHRAVSKVGSEKTFKGGLADHTEQVKKLHTATHLLHKALRLVLGDHVMQKGSNITSERLRFDFSHPDKMTDEEIRKVEAMVNAQIDRKLDVSWAVVRLEKAMSEGAIALFGEKYEEKVKVYAIGDFSKEVCGGPHVENTGSLGKFRITKEQSSSAGIRRVRAVLDTT
jgi:alanyl-tRNA synthetase